MKCSNCGNDLLVGEVRKGLARLLALLPVAAYTCVRCGKTSLRLNDLYTSGPARIILAAALLALLTAGGTQLLHLAESGHPHSVRCEVDRGTPAVAAPARNAAQQATASDKAPDPDAETPAQAAPPADSTDAAEATAAPVEQQAPPADAAPDAAEDALAQAAPALNAPAPAQEPPLEEIVVAAPPKPARPGGQARGKDAAPRARLAGVETGVWNGALVVTLAVDGASGRPTGFSLDSPPRYVVDVPGRWAYSGPRTLPVDAGTARALRLGVHENRLRVVLDLLAPPAQASVRSTDKGLVITIR